MIGLKRYLRLEERYRVVVVVAVVVVFSKRKLIGWGASYRAAAICGRFFLRANDDEEALFIIPCPIACCGLACCCSKSRMTMLAIEKRALAISRSARMKNSLLHALSSKSNFFSDRGKNEARGDDASREGRRNGKRVSGG